MTTQVTAEDFNDNILNFPPCDLWEFYGSEGKELFLYRCGNAIHQAQRGEAGNNYSYHTLDESEFNTLFALQNDHELAISTFDGWVA